MKTVRLVLPLTLLLAGAPLAGCSDTRQALGYEKSPPDEFQVMRRAPLSMPPEYRLRPPEPGKRRPQEETPREQAEKALFGERRQGGDGGAGHDLSAGGHALLGAAGALEADSGIRARVNRETARRSQESEVFTERLMFWDSKPESGTRLDAQAEQKRLQENQALGRPVTEGETPVIERRPKALLEGVFD